MCDCKNSETNYHELVNKFPTLNEMKGKHDITASKYMFERPLDLFFPFLANRIFSQNTTQYICYCSGYCIAIRKRKAMQTNSITGKK